METASFIFQRQANVVHHAELIKIAKKASPVGLWPRAVFWYNIKMFGRLKDFAKNHQADIVLFLGVILISLLSFAMGYILAKQQNKEPIQFEKSTNNEFIPNIRIRKLVTDSLFADLL